MNYINSIILFIIIGVFSNCTQPNTINLIASNEADSAYLNQYSDSATGNIANIPSKYLTAVSEDLSKGVVLSLLYDCSEYIIAVGIPFVDISDKNHTLIITFENDERMILHSIYKSSYGKLKFFLVNSIYNKTLETVPIKNIEYYNRDENDKYVVELNNMNARYFIQILYSHKNNLYIVK